MPAWALDVWSEPPAAFHARALPDPMVRAVWICEPSIATLVLGSGQRDDVVDVEACRRAGVAVARRHSGGGAVLVEPGGGLWLDVLVPAGDPRWDPDVGRAFLWLGGVWAAALTDLGVAATVHRGPLVRTRWSDLVCFGGLGTGEVVGDDGAKLVGLSQRRTRAGARFQCLAPASWDPGSIVDLLALTPQDRVRARQELVGAARGAPVPLDALRSAVLAQLARA